MQVICSDTNIWIDFQYLNRIEWPFLLEYTYIISRWALEDEFLSPIHQTPLLEERGLMAVELTDEELELFVSLREKYHRLSDYDTVALTIAKSRNIVLLTGDKALRNAATAEGVQPRGLLWITDQLYSLQLISQADHCSCMQELLNGLGNPYRYPRHEIENRLNR